MPALTPDTAARVAARKARAAVYAAKVADRSARQNADRLARLADASSTPNLRAWNAVQRAAVHTHTDLLTASDRGRGMACGFQPREIGRTGPVLAMPGHRADTAPTPRPVRIRSERRADIDPWDGLGPILASLGPALSDGWQVWQGSDYGPTGAIRTHGLPGTRSGKRAARTDHFAWCAECAETHACRVADHRDWECSEHGADHVVGCDVPAGLDDGQPAATWSVDASPRADRISARYVDTDRGRTVTNGKRGTFAFRAKGRRGQYVRPEPSEPVTTPGMIWPTRTRAPRADAGKVAVYRGQAAPLAASLKRGQLVKVVNATGAPMRGKVTAATRAALVKRDATAARVIDRQDKVTAAARSRAARVAATAPRAARVRADAITAATAAKVAELTARADAMRAAR